MPNENKARIILDERFTPFFVDKELGKNFNKDITTGKTKEHASLFNLNEHVILTDEAKSIIETNATASLDAEADKVKKIKLSHEQSNISELTESAPSLVEHSKKTKKKSKVKNDNETELKYGSSNKHDKQTVLKQSNSSLDQITHKVDKKKHNKRSTDEQDNKLKKKLKSSKNDTSNDVDKKSSSKTAEHDDVLSKKHHCNQADGSEADKNYHKKSKKKSNKHKKDCDRVRKKNKFANPVNDQSADYQKELDKMSDSELPETFEQYQMLIAKKKRSLADEKYFKDDDSSSSDSDFEQPVQDELTTVSLDNEVTKLTGKAQLGNASSRISITGCLWDDITAKDLFVLCNSLVTDAILMNDGKNILKSDAIKQIDIYMSEFGFKNLEEERKSGPQLLKQQAMNSDDSVNGDLMKINARRYAIQRSLYYFAIVTCVSADIASQLYKELDGTDLEFAVDFLDVRFVPDSLTSFPREPIDTAVGIPTNYSPSILFQSIFKHSNANCDWDSTSKKRCAILRHKFTADEINELDIKEYCASDSDHESGNMAEREAKAKMLKQLVTGLLTQSTTGTVDDEVAHSTNADLVEDNLLSDNSDHEFNIGMADNDKYDNIDAEDNTNDDLSHYIPTSIADDTAEATNDLKKNKISKRSMSKLAINKKKLKQKELQSLVEKTAKGLQEDERFKKMFEDPDNFIDSYDLQQVINKV